MGSKLFVLVNKSTNIIEEFVFASHDAICPMEKDGFLCREVTSKHFIDDPASMIGKKYGGRI